MSVIVLVVGIVVTGLGLAALGFAIPIIGLALGASLISAGTTAVCGGLLLIGLSAAIAELRRVGDLLKARPMAVRRPVDREAAASAQAPAVAAAPTMSAPTHAPPLPPTPQVPSATSLGPILAAASQPQSAAPTPPAPPPSPSPRQQPPARQRAEVPVAQDLRHDHRAAEPALPPAIDASASAIERLRSSMPRAERSRGEPVVVPEGDEAPLSPNGAHASTSTRRSAGEPSLEPRLSPDDRLGAATAETAKSSRLDFLFRSRQAAARSEASEPSRPAGPARSAPDAAGPTRFAEPARSGTAASTSTSAPMPTLPMTPTIEPRPRDLGAKAVDPSGSVLKSGVVDGLAYTLYSDGSIEANLPDGTVRFGSIAELRAHIEKHP